MINCKENSEYLLMEHTDRISAFDRGIGIVPGKGQILANISRWWFEQTKYITPNHYCGLEGRSMLVKKCEPIPIEWIVRAYITGNSSTSMWTNYDNECREYCGHTLPDGLVKNQQLPKLYITPTTKGETDELISLDYIVTNGILTQEEVDDICQRCYQLFHYGATVANSKGLLLVDTKYEFGKIGDDILLIDEIHTPDSSRYWVKDSYLERFNDGLEPEKYDKDVMREWVKANDKVQVPAEIVQQVYDAYATVHKKLLGYGPVIRDVTTLQAKRGFFGEGRKKAVIISGSKSDAEHVAKIRESLRMYDITSEWMVGSAHKNTVEVLEMLRAVERSNSSVVYITVAGRSNALSGVVACNTHFPVIACPPLSSKEDYLVNIHSTLQMPSNTPVLTVLDPGNCALATARILQ